VLAKAFKINDRTFSLLGQSALPHFLSSIQLFQRWLTASSDEPFQDVAAEVLSFSIDVQSASSLLEVHLHLQPEPVAEHRFMFKSTPEVRADRGPKLNTLPFGLTMPKRKRRQGDRKQGAAKKIRESFFTTCKRKQATSSSDSSDDSSSHSSSSDSSSSDSEAIDEDIAPPNAADIEELQNLKKLEIECEAELKRKFDLAELHKTNAKTFFKKDIGFDECNVAVSSGSKCLQCGEAIAKGSIRFSYFWHARRPSRWISEFCIEPFCLKGSPDENNSKRSQALSALRVCQDHPKNTRAMEASIHFQIMRLQSHNAASSSSGGAQ
jgi:hypothetical protein